MPDITLRPYQETVVADIRGAFASHRRVLAVSPTGSGKTHMFAYITKHAAAKGNAVYIVAHRAEITTQISIALDAMGVRHGRIQPGHTMTSDPVQVAMIQSLARRMDRVRMPRLLVIDEAHHSPAGTYGTVTDAWPGAKVLGVTATPARLDGRGLGNSFDAMVLGPTVATLIEAGFLAKFRYLAPPQQADLSGIRTSMGDYAIDDLAEAMDKSVITGDAVAHYRDHLQGRPAIAFCVTVAHAEHVADQFRAAGFRAASVDGKMDTRERRDRIEGIGNGRYQVITSCELLGEGVDCPIVAGAILLRPTKSLAMFLQQVGRSLRPKPDGSDAVILDHVGNVNRHGLPDAERVWSLDTKKRKTPPPPVATCEVCYRIFDSARPGWKAHATCPNGTPPPDGCILEVVEGVGRAPPAQVEGQLEQITATPEWAGGRDITKEKLPVVLELAHTAEQLRQVAKLRGYKRGWLDHVLRARAAKAAELQAQEVARFGPSQGVAHG